ncbi:MAG: type III-B CRISPR module RAMP protein Cmr4 [Anaerolineaceae bacterium]|nr:type III-B CRISPR module RAMP protein Cmr4 [Anaerolineaceae bacterium]
MFETRVTLFLYAESALHAGMGSGLGAVDLPIQRERTTNYPIIQSSGVKGALRQLMDDDTANLVFGEQEYAGAASPGDARILLFPVRSLSGVFVWVTSPAVLARFSRDVLKGQGSVPVIDRDTCLVSSQAICAGNDVMLEEFAYTAQNSNEAENWATFFADHVLPQSGDYAHYRERMRTHLAILPDNDFRDFVTYSTEVITRIKIDPQTKTVATGALFTQELLPADTVLYSVVELTDVRDKDSKHDAGWITQQLYTATAYFNDRFQIGGDETVGRGLVKASWMSEG